MVFVKDACLNRLLFNVFFAAILLVVERFSQNAGMYGHTCSKSMDQPSKVANPARGQLNRRNEYFSVPVRACEFGLGRWVRQSCPASACSSPYSRLNLVLTCGVPPEFRGGVHLFIQTHHTPSG